MREPASVSIPRPAAAALAIAILVLVAAVAFLLGRGNASSPAATAAPSAAPPATAALSTAPMPAAEPGSGTAAREPAGGADDGAAAPPVVAAAAPKATPAAPPPPPDNSAAAEQTAVREYFARLDLELASSSGIGNPQQAAMATLQDLSGDGVKTIAADQRRTRDRIAAIAPPAPCAAHHAKTLAAMDRGVAMLDALARSMSGGQHDGLAAISDEGRAVEAEARAVDALATQIKARYGID